MTLAAGDDFQGQRIVVIGGTSGIGAAIARRVEQAGAEVLAAGRQHLDVTNEASVRAFFQALGPIDHLVTTAASVVSGPFRGGDMEDVRRSMESKFWGQYLCARHAKVRRPILLFSGGYSRRPRSGTSIIAAANGAIEAFARALAVELAPIRVNVVSPGLVRGTAAFDKMPEANRHEMFSQVASRLPAGIVGDPDSIAGPALALLASSYATGTVLDIDGGGLLV